MNLAQRKAHARIWPLIALALIVILGASIAVKPQVSSPSPAAQDETPR
ncbi:hypothetical protein ACN2C6_00310 [Caulobacter sp. ErkDOM-YI]